MERSTPYTVETFIPIKPRPERPSYREIQISPCHPVASAGIFLQVGIGLQFWVNILLTLLGYIPGIIHAIYIIVK